MKRILFLIVACLTVRAAHSQWTTSGNNIYNSNTGNVGVGLTSPAYPLHIQGKGSGAGTRSLYVQNSSGTQTFSVGDDGTAYIPYAIVSADLSVNSSSTGTFHIRSGGSTNSAFTMFGAGGNNGSNYGGLGNDSFYIAFDTRSGQAPLRFINTSSSHDAFDIFSNGHLGVNTSNVDNGNLFQVNGNLWTTGFKLPTGAAAGKVLTSDASGNATWQTAGSSSGWALNGNTDGVIKTIGTADNYDFPIITNNVERLRITAGGNVAIGTTNPQGYMLAVNGSAIFTAAWVKPNANWPDYVFQKDYHLPGLDSLSRYIQLNKHLPEMPSAETVSKTGIDLGGNQAALLKKVEELTLYLIDQDKTMQDYQQKLADQQGKLEAQQQKLDAQQRQLADQQKRLERLEKMMNK